MSTEGDLRTLAFVCTKIWVVVNYSSLQLKSMRFSIIINYYSWIFSL